MACHNAKLALSASVYDLLWGMGARADRWFSDCDLPVQQMEQSVCRGLLIPEARL